MLLQAIGHYGSARKNLDIVVEDENGAISGRLRLTALCDIYSAVVSGYHFGLGEPKLQLTVAALWHTIIHRNYPLEDSLLGRGTVYGVPKILMVDASTF
jgi:hypothetical protein